MLENTVTADKIGGGIVREYGVFAHVVTVILPVYAALWAVGVVGLSVVTWAGIVGLTTACLSVDVYARRLTHNSWKPHKVFWGSMIATIPLSMGVSALVLVPGYFVEKALAT
jgi:hypothetical protein